MTIERDAAALFRQATISLGLEDVGDEAATAALAQAVPVSLRPGEILMEEDGAFDGVLFVVRGRLRLTRAAGGEALEVLRVLGPGAFLGRALEAATERDITVHAAGRCELLCFPQACLDDPAWGLRGLAAALTGPQREASGGEPGSSIRPRADELVDRLALAEFWGALGRKALEELEPWLDWLDAPGGTVITRAGEASDRLFILLDGRLSVFLEEERGERWIGEVTPGETVGELGVFDREPRSATVRAARDSQLVSLSSEACWELFALHPEMTWPVIKMLTRRIRRKDRRPQRPRSTLLVVGLSPEVPLGGFARRLQASLAERETVAYLDADTIERSHGEGAAGARRGSPQFGRVGRWFSRLERENKLLMMVCGPREPAWLRRCLRQADSVILVARAESQPEQPVLDALADLPALSKRLVLLHDTAAPPDDTARWLSATEPSSHHHVHLSRDEDFGRLARLLTGRAVGLTLGGGGARGLAHLGVVRALAEAGVPVDVVGGTSIGSFLAGQVAMGWSHEEMVHRNYHYWAERKPTRDYTLPLVGLLAGRRAERLFEEVFGARRIEDLWLGFFCVATNLTRARAEVFHAGLLSQAVRASTSLPGIFPPVYRDGDVLIDGCVMNNLPGDIMRSVSRGRVITVDVNPPTDMRVDPTLDACPAGLDLLGRLVGEKLSKAKRAHPTPTLPEILTRAGNVASMHRGAQVKASSDLHIAPPVDAYQTFDWGSLHELEEIGYRAAAAALESWSG